MRLVTYRDAAGTDAIGALIDDDRSVVDLGVANAALGVGPADWFSDMLSLIRAGDPALDTAREVVSGALAGKHDAVHETAAVSLLAPVPIPEQMRDCLSFEKHYRQAREGRLQALAAKAADPEAEESRLRASGQFEIPKVWYDLAVYYKCNRFSVVGTEMDIRWPRYCEQLDYELEFGVFLKGPVKDVSEADASKHIFGYTIFNDMSARDMQSIEMAAGLGPAKSKDFDTGNVLGPCLVTADEIPDPYDLTMEVRVNGELRGRGSSSEMHHKFEAMIARMSEEETLHPGEFIASGTVGDGSGVEHGRYLEPGDLIELTVEHIGTLRNRVVRSI